MADVDELAQRTSTLVTSLARRGMTLAAGVAAVVFVVGGLAYLTGLAGLEGSVRSAWVVVGAVMLVVAVGAPLLARWRLRGVLRDTTQLISELTSLIKRDDSAQRVVIETVPVDPPTAGQPGDVRPMMLFETRQFTRLRQVSMNANDLRHLPGAMQAVTSFPLMLAVALIGVIVFAVLGFLFLIAWVL